MTRIWQLTGRSLALAALAGCATAKTKEPVVTTAGGESKVSESGTAAANRGKSLVRLINAIPGDRTVDVTGDNRAVFYDVGYKTVTPYTEVGDNVVKFRLRAGGTDTVWAENTETLTNGNRYTIVALPTADGGAKLTVLTDDVVPDQGKARLRVVHAAPVLKDVDVKLEGHKDALFSKVGFGSGSGYSDIDPGNAVILINRLDPPGTALKMQRMRLDAGKSYTVVLTGTQGGLQTIVVTDALRTYAIQ